MRTVRALLLTLLLVAPSRGQADGKPPPSHTWLPDEMPLPLPVRRPQDLEYKEITEREYLIFNLLATGKVAWDAGRWADAAEAWESLLQLPGLDQRIDKVVRPLAIEARQKAGQGPTVSATPPPPAVPVPPEPAAEETTRSSRRRGRTHGGVDVTGTISGGGPSGPGGAVVWLTRADGKTPTPSSEGEFVVHQQRKTFLPHVLAVPLGATVSFQNDDPIFHDVFSSSAPNDFDLGLYKSGLARTQVFTHPGAVNLLCNIHAQMNAWVYVVDSPWYAVADGAGQFRIHGVPPGSYRVEVWHEASSQNATSSVTVSSSMEPLALSVGGDRRPPAYPPDKYGHPRQPQLGY